MSCDAEAWERFYDAGTHIMVWPSEPVVRFVRRYRAREGSGRRALDLGCGNGRHLHLLCREGYQSHGCDASATAVALANEWLEREGYEPAARVSRGSELPYEAESFDIILSYGVLDSMLAETAQGLVAEAWRCLAPGGEIFVTLRASADRDFMLSGREVAKNTILVEDEVECGTLQHFFDLSEVRDLFARFELLGVEREDRIDWLDTGRKYSRWEVRAAKPR